MKKIGVSNEYHLKGTNDNNKIRKTDDSEIIKKLGLIDYIVLSPSEYLCDDIADSNADERYNRIHEMCGVIKFTYGTTPKSILITGDSDKKAWKDHITQYHKDKLPSNVLSASHHGSRTFFKTNEEDEDIFEDHIKEINPTYLIISAPKQKESPYGHPHDDAMELYKNHVDQDNILHLGKNIESVIVDIEEDGNIIVSVDKELATEYGKKADNNNDGGSSKNASIVGARTTKIDNKPMG